MGVPITQDKWTSVRRSLAETGDRFAELLVSASASNARATRDWSVPETAAHVATLARSCAAVVNPDGGSLPFPEGEEMFRSTSVDTVDKFNETLLGEFAERDPGELRRLIRTDLYRVLRSTETDDPARAVTWLGDSKVPLAGVLAHMLNELQIHGWDIARAAQAPWTVTAEEAGLFFDLFLVGVTHYGYGHLLDGHGPAPKGRVTVEFRSGYTTPMVMVLTDGLVTVERPGGPVDVRLSFDPVVLNLMLFGRVSRRRAALTGKVVIRGGRRPWMLPGFLRIVRLPS